MRFGHGPLCALPLAIATPKVSALVPVNLKGEPHL
jgi:hypothetical protein